MRVVKNSAFIRTISIHTVGVIVLSFSAVYVSIVEECTAGSAGICSTRGCPVWCPSRVSKCTCICFVYLARKKKSLEIFKLSAHTIAWYTIKKTILHADSHERKYSVWHQSIGEGVLLCESLHKVCWDVRSI